MKKNLINLNKGDVMSLKKGEIQNIKHENGLTSGEIKFRDVIYTFQVEDEKNLMINGLDVIFRTNKDNVVTDLEVIEEELEVCAYCGDEATSFTCCGENHFEEVYITANYNTYQKEALS